MFGTLLKLATALTLTQGLALAIVLWLHTPQAVAQSSANDTNNNLNHTLQIASAGLSPAMPPALLQSKSTSDKPKVVTFSAQWCSPCQQLKPVLEKVKRRYGKKINFVAVDVDDPSSHHLMKKYAVASIPSMIFLDADGNVVSWIVGYQGTEEVDWACRQLNHHN
ncbi:MAG: thioredoxin fold domain-containing protein [Candidatus Melainabacteria bacterium]|nr:thioredoxin fold domain-containing protein [Candidatus Melainabacteria bacterium]